MSGGYFDYKQFELSEMAEKLQKLILLNHDGFTNATLEKFKTALQTVEAAAFMVHRVDWLVSGDDSEETFHKRWRDEADKFWGK